MGPTARSGGRLKVGEATAAKRRLDLEPAEHRATIDMRESEPSPTPLVNPISRANAHANANANANAYANANANAYANANANAYANANAHARAWACA